MFCGVLPPTQEKINVVVTSRSVTSMKKSIGNFRLGIMCEGGGPAQC